MHAIEWRLLDAGMRATNHDGIEWLLRVLGMVFWTIRRVYGVLGGQDGVELTVSSTLLL